MHRQVQRHPRVTNHALPHTGVGSSLDVKEMQEVDLLCTCPIHGRQTWGSNCPKLCQSPTRDTVCNDSSNSEASSATETQIPTASADAADLLFISARDVLGVTKRNSSLHTEQISHCQLVIHRQKVAAALCTHKARMLLKCKSQASREPPSNVLENKKKTGVDCRAASEIHRKIHTSLCACRLELVVEYKMTEAQPWCHVQLQSAWRLLQHPTPMGPAQPEPNLKCDLVRAPPLAPPHTYLSPGQHAQLLADPSEGESLVPGPVREGRGRRHVESGSASRLRRISSHTFRCDPERSHSILPSQVRSSEGSRVHVESAQSNSHVIRHSPTKFTAQFLFSWDATVSSTTLWHLTAHWLRSQNLHSSRCFISGSADSSCTLATHLAP